MTKPGLVNLQRLDGPNTADKKNLASALRHYTWLVGRLHLSLRCYGAPFHLSLVRGEYRVASMRRNGKRQGITTYFGAWRLRTLHQRNPRPCRFMVLLVERSHVKLGISRMSKVFPLNAFWPFDFCSRSAIALEI